MENLRPIECVCFDAIFNGAGRVEAGSFLGPIGRHDCHRDRRSREARCVFLRLDHHHLLLQVLLHGWQAKVDEKEAHEENLEEHPQATHRCQHNCHGRTLDQRVLKQWMVESI